MDRIDNPMNKTKDIRVGILGGGFNPPHKAHLFAVTDALSSGRFDEIWILPCWNHALDKNADLLPFNFRMEMCRRAFAQWPNVVVRPYEKVYQTKYTVDLMDALIKDYEDRKFTLIVGSDNIAAKDKWKNWSYLETLVDFYVLPRPGTTNNIRNMFDIGSTVLSHPDNIWQMPDISSTRIRYLIAAHKTNWPYIETMVPKAVWEYIQDKGLYLEKGAIMPVNLDKEIKRVLKNGNWMLRRSDGGESYGGFQWEPIGEWTEAPDWRPTDECGHGLHGNSPKSKGFWSYGKDLDFCEYDPRDVVKLGGKIKVKRARILMRNQLPDGLKFRGDLDLTNTFITELPKGLTVGGSLDLRNSAIETLPDGLKVGGYLDLRDTNIQKLPDGLKVGKNLCIRDTPITELPKGLKVGWDIDLGRTPIKSLPDDLKIKGCLDLRGSDIENLPKNLKIRGSLNLQDTPIKALPKDLMVKGTLNIHGTPIKTLPEYLKVGESLYLGGTSVTSLPKGLIVGGYIFLEGISIEPCKRSNIKQGYQI